MVVHEKDIWNVDRVAEGVIVAADPGITARRLR